jgi:hypothetical protein
VSWVPFPSPECVSRQRVPDVVESQRATPLIPPLSWHLRDRHPPRVGPTNQYRAWPE